MRYGSNNNCGGLWYQLCRTDLIHFLFNKHLFKLTNGAPLPVISRVWYVNKVILLMKDKHVKQEPHMPTDTLHGEWNMSSSLAHLRWRNSLTSQRWYRVFGFLVAITTNVSMMDSSNGNAEGSPWNFVLWMCYLLSPLWTSRFFNDVFA